MNAHSFIQEFCVLQNNPRVPVWCVGRVDRQCKVNLVTTITEQEKAGLGSAYEIIRSVPELHFRRSLCRDAQAVKINIYASKCFWW